VDYFRGPGRGLHSWTTLADHSHGPIVKHRILEVCMIEFLTVRGKMCMSRFPSLSSWKLYTKCEVLNPFTISPPPRRQKNFRSVYHFRGPKNFRTYQNFSKHHTNFPDITKFPTKLTKFRTKLTEFVPFFFIISQYCPTVERILPDLLCLPNKLGGGWR
jgi:hypothetical protein